MSVHLITGYAGKEHITSADQGSFNAAIMGGGEFVMERGEQFRCQVISNNQVRIYDGDALMQGRHILIDRNTYVETTHDNGTQGYKRIDLIVLTYEKNAVTSIETVKLEVIKGTPAESNPSVPGYITGDILNSGEAKNQMPLYKIPFDGLSIGEPVKLFSTVPTLETMKIEVDEKVDDKIEEFEESFSELEGSIDEKIAEAGKPLSSSASDWSLIQNYGEYSADAKTVGIELSKKVDEVSGKGLSTNDYTTDEKNKLAGIATGANKTTVDSSLSTSSTNPVQNKVVAEALNNKVSVVSGKGLSTNDYTTTEKNKLSGIATGATKNVVDSSLSTSSTNAIQNKVVATSINTINSNLGGLKFGKDGDGNYGYYGADGSLIPFKKALTPTVLKSFKTNTAWTYTVSKDCYIQVISPVKSANNYWGKITINNVEIEKYNSDTTSSSDWAGGYSKVYYCKKGNVVKSEVVNSGYQYNASLIQWN